jgi:glycerol-3-phosphate O-acyltransferase
MSALRSFCYLLLKFPVRLLVRFKTVLDKPINNDDKSQPIFYIVRHQSASDILSLQKACKEQNLPDPLSDVEIKGKRYLRTLCLAKPTALLPWRKSSETTALQQGLDLLNAHNDDKELDALLIPANIIWGRAPTKENNNANVGSLLAEQQSPNWFRKFLIVLFSGRDALLRLSTPLSIRTMSDSHGNDEDTAHKLLRVARFHFHRQSIAAKGPRLMHREQMFTALFASPAIKQIIKEESEFKKIDEDKVKKQARSIMKEIAGDYSVSLINVGERVLHWLWGRLYKDIKVSNAEVIRQLGQDGHEIIYVPCHRSHMDYLLLTYIILHEGMVTPRIAAGINLNFWPAGNIFRKAGAFFLRRSFAGNRLYSTIFREYLGLLFERGYSVKYYTEGGRSRTGRLLQPKTGMIAMTIQSMLRGIDRPLSLVPVYLGYEHVMEVGTYHKELSGSQKKGESIFGVIKAIKNLRNYGNGYVNFGTPITINSFLNKEVPHWKEAINPIEPQKPTWLTPTVNTLANKVMKEINQSVALNPVSLTALILLASENKALSKRDLEKALDFCQDIQRHTPYSKNMTIPEESGEELLAHVISLNKVVETKDSLGTIISLEQNAALEMSYYRNNIIHTFVLPALVSRILMSNTKISNEQLTEQTQMLLALLVEDLFLYQTPEQVATQIEGVLAFLSKQHMVKHSKAGYWSLTDEPTLLTHIHLLGECIDESLQRLAIITSLTTRLAPVSRRDLEESVVSIAKRLSVLNNINAPEFIDKKAQAVLINSMKEQGYTRLNDDGLVVTTDKMADIKAIVNNLVAIEVLQSIAK